MKNENINNINAETLETSSTQQNANDDDDDDYTGKFSTHYLWSWLL